MLPMTPQSPASRSPAAGAATLAGNAALPARNAAVNQDLEVVHELLGTMKLMLGTLGSTFDVLGDQTIKVATLPAAIDAVHQIATVRQQLDDQHKGQEERMMEVKRLLLEEVRNRLYVRLKDTASTIVREIIQREIAERVRKQLQEQVPQSMRDEVIRYKHQIMEVKVSLHNSEARRHNALIRSNSLDEPLRPLLRPPPSLDDVFPPLAPSDGDGSETPRPSLSGTAINDPSRPSLTIDASVDWKTATAGRKSAIHGRVARSAATPLSAMDLQDPAPSPRFPRDLGNLTRLSPVETKELMRDYGLVKLKQVVHRGNGGGEDTPTVDDPEPEVVQFVEAEESQEETLNRFLSYIGVQSFRLAPTAPVSPPHARGVAVGVPAAIPMSV